MEARREQMVTTGMFLESARNLGIKSLEGVCEIVDNSFDADAWNIRIHIEREKGESLQITFTDDGVGIPREHIDSDGISHQGIPYVLAYGGRIPHPHQEAPVGKFGWGLSQTACCLSMRTEVYTKTVDDDRWRLGYYDLRELAEARAAEATAGFHADRAAIRRQQERAEPRKPPPPGEPDGGALLTQGRGRPALFIGIAPADADLSEAWEIGPNPFPQCNRKVEKLFFKIHTRQQSPPEDS